MRRQRRPSATLEELRLQAKRPARLPDPPTREAIRPEPNSGKRKRPNHHAAARGLSHLEAANRAVILERETTQLLAMVAAASAIPLAMIAPPKRRRFSAETPAADPPPADQVDDGRQWQAEICPRFGSWQPLGPPMSLAGARELIRWNRELDAKPPRGHYAYRIQPVANEDQSEPAAPGAAGGPDAKAEPQPAVV